MVGDELFKTLFFDEERRFGDVKPSFVKNIGQNTNAVLFKFVAFYR